MRLWRQPFLRWKFIPAEKKFLGCKLIKLLVLFPKRIAG